ncbi:hypothetical protein [Bradyrhizobium sp. WSM471]|uniref:hypothetical protein n=1 Tax=Bradyrhizobium sp. WSM471 TaxID=319017 RepID=UPI00055EF423|nr:MULTISPECIES: hypothetical protein [Bradyrhizobium]UFW42915.1 hypothetical protein BcanWSM471_07020 [Bradyrhizobium canariense]
MVEQVKIRATSGAGEALCHRPASSKLQAMPIIVSGAFEFDMLALELPRSDCCSNRVRLPTACALKSALKMCKVLVAVASSLPKKMPDEYSTDLIGRRITPPFGISEGMSAVQTSVIYRKRCIKPQTQPAMAAGTSKGEPVTLGNDQTTAGLMNAILPVSNVSALAM